MTYNLLEPAARITDECGDGTLMCPVCGEGYLHPGKVTEFREGGVQIAFGCEHCSMPEMSLADTVGNLIILHHKGNTHVTWEVNPAFMNAERVQEHERLLKEYYNILGKLCAIRGVTKHTTSLDDLKAAVLEWDK
jgi:hypothetical protein